MTSNLAIFASGGGSNAEAIIEYFKNSDLGNVALIVTNNENAKVIDRAQNHEIPFYILEAGELEEGEFSDVLIAMEIDFVVLAGFLKKIPQDILAAYPQKIVNIHPALLPNYGGKGMYGKNVHEAVKAAGDTESGITIHYVNENYDEGQVIVQQKVSLAPTDDALEIANKVLALEHEFYPKTIASLLS
ncbi:phosphoribosylglycinamide formyltransferase [Putridiphycobacter roseus]|uniref:phosphoribosylglycinamide formyltransferase 1 n=1 Tax=Putridiphycobacter roseus TaxID=2219161 RepID=A0A2W1NCE3_9FLAO|nr:phosphoribosylglycinamide formyltransferase [Putridiphycobacter roseus]PZE17035.1 phosphoribosylglycinamide formyltransferase [Putridiphycobacter roseus]